jgi:hypothetical protein
MAVSPFRTSQADWPRGGDAAIKHAAVGAQR